MEISGIRARAVTVPIQAPLRHSYGVHEAFTRTIVQVETDEGLTGLAETAALPAHVEEAGRAVIGINPFDLEVIRSRIAQRFYWSREPLVVAAIEMACIDLQGKATGLPAYRLLGGRLRDSVDMAAYCFYRYERDGQGEVATPEQMAVHAAELVDEYGYQTVKLKAGVLDPAIEVATIELLRDKLGPDVRLRIDPNAAWTPLTAAGLLPRLERAGLEYLEDPAAGIEGMSTVREKTRLPLATNMCVVDFDQLVPAARRGAVDVVLSDPWYWGGPTQVRLLAAMCQHLGLSIGMHSGIELGIGMAMMAHVAVTLPNLHAAVDAHYHHLTDDVIAGERLLPSGGRIRPPAGPGWGVELDPAKVAMYGELHDSGLYANLYVSADSHGPDARRPGWHPVMPAW